MKGRLRALTRRAGDEGGFGLTELMVAIGVLFVALLALARTATLAFTDVAAARQRQTATQLANRLLEEVRGLPYEAVQKGLANEDLGGDPRIAICGGEYYFPACPPAAGAEKLVHTPGLAPAAPLVPHRGEVGPPAFPSTFTWSVYVTEAADAPSAGAYRVTVRVSWEANQRRGLRDFVEAQSLIYSPEGCVDPATHPFSAPCQPYFYGNGTVGGGSATTTGTIQDVAWESVAVDFVRQSSDAQVEQVTRVEGAANLPLASAVAAAGESGTTAVGVETFADDDPSTVADTYASDSTMPQATGSVSVAGGGNSLGVVIGGGAQGSSVSTTAASTVNTCNLQIDQQACGHATVTQAGTIVETLNLSTDVGSADLLSVGPITEESSSYLQRSIPAGSEGLVREAVEWTLPTVTIGDLPSGLSATPAGWDGYWVRLSGFSATATAEAGVGTAAPAVAIGGGQISYWNGSGYATKTIDAAGGAVLVAPVDHSAGDGLGNTVHVEMGGTVTVQPSTTSEQADGSERVEARAVVGSPLVVELAYRVTRNEVEMADLVLEMDAGIARAHTFYQPAPTG